MKQFSYATWGLLILALIVCTLNSMAQESHAPMQVTGESFVLIGSEAGNFLFEDGLNPLAESIVW